MKRVTILSTLALIAAGVPTLKAAMTAPSFLPRPSGMAALPVLNLTRPLAAVAVRDLSVPTVEERVRLTDLINSQA